MARASLAPRRARCGAGGHGGRHPAESRVQRSLRPAGAVYASRPSEPRMPNAAADLLPAAIVYDFDGTLAPGNIQEHSLIPNHFNTTKEEFWREVHDEAKGAGRGPDPRLHAATPRACEQDREADHACRAGGARPEDAAVPGGGWVVRPDQRVRPGEEARAGALRHLLRQRGDDRQDLDRPALPQ